MMTVKLTHKQQQIFDYIASKHPDFIKPADISSALKNSNHSSWSLDTCRSLAKKGLLIEGTYENRVCGGTAHCYKVNKDNEQASQRLFEIMIEKGNNPLRSWEKVNVPIRETKRD